MLTASNWKYMKEDDNQFERLTFVTVNDFQPNLELLANLDFGILLHFNPDTC